MSAENRGARLLGKMALAATLLACGDSGSGSGPMDTDTEGSSTGSTTEPTSGPSTTAQTSSGNDSGSATAVSCEDGQYEDDIVLSVAAELPRAAHRSHRVEGGTVVCGDGFVAVLGDAPATLEDAGLSGTCTGLDVAGERVLMTTDAGAVVLASLNPLAVLEVVTEDGPRFDVLFDDDATAWIAAGPQGVQRVSIDGDVLGERTEIEGAQDARGLARAGDRLLIADGYVLGDIDDPTVGGARYTLVDPDGGGVVNTLVEGPGFAQRIAVLGDHIVGVRPGFGLDLLDVDGDSLSMLGGVELDEVVHDVAGFGDTLLAAAGTSLIRVAVEGNTLTRISSEGRPDRGEVQGAWFRTVVADEQGASAGHGTSWFGVELAAGDPAPEVALEVHTFTMTPDQTEALFGLDNLGTAPLVVREVAAEPPFSAEVAADLNGPTPGCTDHFVVEPGGRLLFWLRHDGTGGATTSPLRVISDDPDEPQLVGLAERGRPALEVGDPAEDFFALGVDGRGFQLSDHLGKVVLAKLYNPL